MIERQPWQRKKKRVVVVLESVVLATVSVLVVMNLFEETPVRSILFFLGSYLLPLVAGLMLYRWPGSKVEGRAGVKYGER